MPQSLLTAQLWKPGQQSPGLEDLPEHIKKSSRKRAFALTRGHSNYQEQSSVEVDNSQSQELVYIDIQDAVRYELVKTFMDPLKVQLLM